MGDKETSPTTSGKGKSERGKGGNSTKTAQKNTFYISILKGTSQAEDLGGRGKGVSLCSTLWSQ